MALKCDSVWFQSVGPWLTRAGTTWNQVGVLSVTNEKAGTARAKHTYQSKCSRCGGAGGADKWRATGWTCYQCGGHGLGPLTTETVWLYLPAAHAVYQAGVDARLAEKEAARQAVIDARQAALAAKLESQKELLAEMETWAPYDSRLASLLEGLRQRGELSDAQMNYLHDHILPAAKARKASEDAKVQSQWVGEVGGRFTWDLDLVVRLSYPTPFGSLEIHIFRDDQGNTLVYKGSAGLGCKGDRIRLTAKVKEHTVYEGNKQTLLSHPKRLSVEQVNPEVG